MSGALSTLIDALCFSKIEIDFFGDAVGSLDVRAGGSRTRNRLSTSLIAGADTVPPPHLSQGLMVQVRLSPAEMTDQGLKEQFPQKPSSTLLKTILSAVSAACLCERPMFVSL